MVTVKIGINGFGRIGRCTLKRCIEMDGIDVVGINDLANIEDLAYLLKYDSISGWYNKEVTNVDNHIQVDGKDIAFFSSREPSQIPWKDVGADIVVESSGAFRRREKAAGHIEAGAKKVIISAPSDDADATIVMGVNENMYQKEEHNVISLASCTTNSLAPVVKVLNDTFGVESLFFTTIHAYTSSQSLMDTPARHRQRGRAAALSIIPTTTGAAKATEKVLPELKGRMNGMAMRVPVPDGSITDITAIVKKDTTPEEVNNAFYQAAEKPEFINILRVSNEALVSRDILGDCHSAVVDAEGTAVVNGRVVKVLSWYDNEWGYSCRLVDFALYINKVENQSYSLSGSSSGHKTINQ
jgi:glyceraldehyde 3-phosphate dehydrogenase